MERHDLIVIGGGAGGFGAVIKANDLGARTALVNTGLPIGGTCVNVGCVPSKRLLWAAEVLHTSQHHKIPGLELDVKHLDVGAIVRDELALVDRMREDKYAAVLRDLEHVTFIQGQARFIDARSVQVGDQTLTSERFVIATGSSAAVPDIPGLREAGFITHAEALRRERQPRSLVVIGAGPVGLEFSQLFARFGSHVTVLQRSNRVFPRTEAILAERLIEIFKAEGIDVVTRARPMSVTSSGNRKRVAFEVDGRAAVVETEEILVAAGKTPNTSQLGLAPVGVRVDDKGAIVVNPYLQTSAAHIFAVGDVASLPARLEMTAGHEGTLAAENALTGSKHSIDYDAVPYTIFTDPQLAGVGLTEDQEMERLGRCLCRTVPLELVPKALIMNRPEGFVKMAIHPDTGQIMGVHLLTPQAGDLVAQAVTLVRNRNTINDLLETLPMFPTLSEAVKLAAMAFTRDISKVSCCV